VTKRWLLEKLEPDIKDFYADKLLAMEEVSYDCTPEVWSQLKERLACLEKPRQGMNSETAKEQALSSLCARDVVDFMLKDQLWATLSGDARPGGKSLAATLLRERGRAGASVLCQPLVVQPDRRAARRHKQLSRRWQWDKVNEWLASGTRALCITGDAAPGNATVSAAFTT
jgi:hypothetical protein